MNNLKRVREHFDREALRFDAIYDTRKPLVQKLLDRIFRAVILERYRLICNLAPVPGSWSVLDVGCGSGRYAMALSHLGAERVIGLDISETMLQIARDEAERNGLGDRCRFIRTEFLSFESKELFEAVLAVGYFDYIESPLAHLKKMHQLCGGRIFASFPKRWEWRVPSRKLRFFLQRGYVRFYSRREVLDLVAAAQIPDRRVSLIDLGRDWILIASTLDEIAED